MSSTSQFASLLAKTRFAVGDAGWKGLRSVPIYSVGPATTRALEIASRSSPLRVFGSHTGNGQALAQFIKTHYHDWYSERPTKPPLLFLVGEQRREIIPRTLMDPELPTDRRIEVVEEVVYVTRVMESFAEDFQEQLKRTDSCSRRWIVVFSPTGCDAMLEGLKLLDDLSVKFRPGSRDGKTFIITIGPTTRSHLSERFGFETDVCADSPTPESILKGIQSFVYKSS